MCLAKRSHYSFETMKLCLNVYGLRRKITTFGVRPGNDDEESLKGANSAKTNREIGIGNIVL